MKLLLTNISNQSLSHILYKGMTAALDVTDAAVMLFSKSHADFPVEESLGIFFHCISFTFCWFLFVIVHYSAYKKKKIAVFTFLNNHSAVYFLYAA